MPGVPGLVEAMWTMICPSVTVLRSSGHHATRPSASRGSAPIVASAWSKQARLQASTSAIDSSSVANMSSLSSGPTPSTSHGNCSSLGRAKVSPK